MKKILFSLFIVFSSLVAFGQNNTPNYIQVEGYHQLKLAPDMIYLNIVLNEADFKNKEMQHIEKSMIDALKKAGVNTKEDLIVMDMASNFKKYFFKGNLPQQTKVYQVIAHSAQETGKIMYSLDAIGISKIDIEKFESSKIDEKIIEAGTLAMKDAKAKASILAAAIDQTIGKAINIVSYSRRPVMLRGYANDAIMLKSSRAEVGASPYIPEVEFEDIEVDYTVTVKFELN